MMLSWLSYRLNKSRNTHFKYFLICILCFGLPNCSDMEIPESPVPIQNDVCDFFQNDDNILEFWIGFNTYQKVPDVKLRIPSAYVLGPFGVPERIKRGKSDGALLINFRLIDFAPNYIYFRKDKIHKNPNPDGHILFDAPISSMNDHFLSRTRQVAGAQKISFPEVLRTGEYTYIANLKLLKVAPDLILDRQTDYYLHIEDENVINILACSKVTLDPEQNYPNPHCSLTTNLGVVSANISFDRDYVGDWRNIRRRSKSFFDCMLLETKP